MNNPIREAFEKWFSDGGEYPKAIEKNGDDYKLMTAASAWRTWQAAMESMQPKTDGLVLLRLNIEKCLALDDGEYQFSTKIFKAGEAISCSKQYLIKIADDSKSLSGLVDRFEILKDGC